MYFIVPPVLFSYNIYLYRNKEINFPLKASPGRGKLSPQVTDEGAGKLLLVGITPHPALRATFPPRGEGFYFGTNFKS